MMNLVTGTIADAPHTAGLVTDVSDSRWRHFYLVSGNKVQCESL